jgi:hypothetical protein
MECERARAAAINGVIHRSCVANIGPVVWSPSGSPSGRVARGRVSLPCFLIEPLRARVSDAIHNDADDVRIHLIEQIQ